MNFQKISRELNDGQLGTIEFQTLGRILAHSSDSIRGIAFLVYEFAEAHNAHDLCALLNWAMNLYDFKHEEDIYRISRLLNTKAYIVNMGEVDTNTGKFLQKKYRMVIHFEEVKE